MHDLIEKRALTTLSLGFGLGQPGETSLTSEVVADDSLLTELNEGTRIQMAARLCGVLPDDLTWSDEAKPAEKAIVE